MATESAASRPKALPDYDFRNDSSPSDRTESSSKQPVQQEQDAAAAQSKENSGSGGGKSDSAKLPAFDDPLPGRVSAMTPEDLVGKGEVMLQRLAVGAGEAVGVGPGSVSVCYLARFLDSGLVFDNGHESTPITLKLTEPDVPSGMLPAWDIALPSLHVGDVALLTVTDPKWAYGEEGLQDIIPPNSKLQFRLTVTAVTRPALPPRSASSSKERLDAAEAAKTDGNAQIAKNPTGALNAYVNGMLWLSDLLPPGSTPPKGNDTVVLKDADEEARAKSLTIALQANTAAARLALKDGEGAVEAAKACIALDPKHVKARFRLAKALKMTGDYPAAKNAIVAAIKLSPNDKRLRETLEEIKAIIAKRAKSALAMFSDPEGDKKREKEAKAAAEAKARSVNPSDPTGNFGAIADSLTSDLTASVAGLEGPASGDVSAEAAAASAAAVSDADVEVIQSQVPDTVSEADIRACLAKHNGDIVNVIMELS